MSHRLWPMLVAAAVGTANAGNWNVPADSRNLLNPVARNPAANARAAHIYATHCRQCHGPSGAGDGSNQKVDYDLRSIATKLTDGELYWKITHGVGRMPSFAGPLTDEQRWLAINHLRNLVDERIAHHDVAKR